eukprot:Hpha_TRINITY_DN35248_c0_g1::TRINITY_DN35248_c0_g1_i1::g.145207::m.145207
MPPGPESWHLRTWASAARPAGGLDVNESQAHFGSWAVISSPLTLGHDLSDDAAYDAAWPVVSNRDAIMVNQAWAGDPGRLIATSGELLNNLTLFHGAGCECPYQGSLPRWAVFAKRLDSGAKSAAAIALNFGNESLPAATIQLGLDQLFGSPGAVGLTSERDIWGKRDIAVQTDTQWTVGELAPRSSYFALLTR